MRSNTLETNTQLLYRLGRGTELVSLGPAAADEPAGTGTPKDRQFNFAPPLEYSMQVVAIRWGITGAGPLVAAVDVDVALNGTVLNTGDPSPIPIGATAGDTGVIVLDDGPFEISDGDALTVLTNGDATNPSQSITYTLALRPL